MLRQELTPSRRTVYMKRFRVTHKGKAAKKFRHQSGRTNMKNMKQGPMRGGIRL